MNSFRLPMPHVFSAAPDLIMGMTFLVTWISPFELGDTMVNYLMLVMLLEFIIIHSSAFMGGVLYGPKPAAAKIKIMIGLGLFYTVFVSAFSLAFSEWWPLFVFWGLILNRMMGALLGQADSGEEKAFVMKGWGVGVAAYLVSVFLSFLLPLPKLGLSSDVISSLNLTGSGEWIDNPHTMIASGFFYFTLVGISELYSHRWVKTYDTPQSNIWT